ncbi:MULTISPECIES: hypothetical protein [Cysteiniphilum]|uniref:Uncharacterized protein n=1 Tax=Cysteiniphilum litorale TaxID=2056700 RepID=A0A8J2Z6K4_9GAMM|nr:MULTISPECIES: hypothetical protein [Cysteiniphilum]WHN65174.1 hypothetical protein NYP54_09000 [Cysteiniphilum sp. QT6929]GGG06566.1 hypothetical protein GCM10010995_25100 [Cysteiniphilum litorale]
MSIVKSLAKAKMENKKVELHTKGGEKLIGIVLSLSDSKVTILLGYSAKRDFLISHLVSVDILDEKIGVSL